MLGESSNTILPKVFFFKSGLPLVKGKASPSTKIQVKGKFASYTCTVTWSKRVFLAIQNLSLFEIDQL